MVIAEGPQGLAGLMDEEESDLEQPEGPPPIMDCRFCGKLNMLRLEWTVHLHTQHNHQISYGAKGSISWCKKSDIPEVRPADGGMPQPMAGGSPVICSGSGGGGGDACEEEQDIVWSPAIDDGTDSTDGGANDWTILHFWTWTTPSTGKPKGNQRAAFANGVDSHEGTAAHHAGANVSARTDGIARQRGRRTPFQVFVGNVSYEATDDDLLWLFNKAQSATILRTQGGASKGCGFVQFPSKDDAQRALATGTTRLARTQHSDHETPHSGTGRLATTAEGDSQRNGSQQQQQQRR